VGLLRGLAARGIDCHVLCPQVLGSAPTLPSDLSVEMVAIPQLTLARIRWNRLVSPLGTLTDGPFAEGLRERARDADVVHFFELETAAAIDVVDRPAVAQLDCLTRRDPRSWNPLRAQGRRSIELLRGELDVRRRARWLLVSSEEIREQLAGAMPRAEVVVAPLALDPSHYKPGATLDSAVAGLIGMARWPPTANAVERLLTRVWPLVLERRPEAKLLLAGDGMERSAFSQLPDLPGVEWRGRVSSAAEFLRELGVLLYPLGAGSGLKVKVLEALALGIPVVTTPDGAEGLGARGGVAVESEDARIALTTVALLEDLGVRRAAGAEAHKTFLLYHTPAIASAAVVELYQRMLS
jgi:glycosyltransferase involved in cell wall biosynthesis